MPGIILARAGEQLERIRADWREARYDRFLPEARHALLHRYADALTRLLPSTTDLPAPLTVAAPSTPPPAAGLPTSLTAGPLPTSLTAGPLPSSLTAGGPPTPATVPFTVDDLLAAGLLPRHRRLVTLLLHLLHEHGLAEHEPARPEDRWRLAAPADPDGLTRALLLRHPAYVTEVALTTRMGRHLPAVLRGEQDPLDLLEDGLLRHLYDVAPLSRLTNRVARALLGQIVAAWPGDRPLRILEVGAGTGGTTAALLPILPPHLTHYTFTDPDPLALTTARRRFSNYDLPAHPDHPDPGHPDPGHPDPGHPDPGHQGPDHPEPDHQGRAHHHRIDYRRLDLGTDPTTQGLTTGGHDVVIAANSLHAAQDLPAALDRVRSLLAPGGHLLAIETHDPGLLLGAFGPLDHAWPATGDPLRPRTRLLRREQWPPLLRECGFTHVTQTGDSTTPARDAFSILLAARPRARNRTRPLPVASGETRWIIAAESEDGLPLADAVAALLSAPDGDVPDEPDPTTSTTSNAATAATDNARQVVAVLAENQPGRWWQELMSAHPTSQRMAVTLVPAEQHPPHPGDQPRSTTLRAIERAFTELPATVNRSLYVITRDTTPDPAPTSPDHSSLHIALHPSENLTADAHKLARELLTTPTDNEVVLTPRGRFVIRELPHTPLTPHALDHTTEPTWTPTTPPPSPGPGMAAVEVRAATLPHPTPSGGWWSCAGVVTAVGPGVPAIRPGDHVAGLAQGTLASHVLTQARLLTPTSRSMSDAEAATTPLPHLHAHLALTVQAKLSPDETLLLHDDATGLGLAALRHALHCGARVIAAARTPAQRDLLLTLGAWRVLDALARDAPRQVLRWTDGRGAEVMAGPVPPGWERALNPDGRYVELGAADPSDPDVFAEVMSGAARDRCLPLPFSAYPATRVREALTSLREGRPLGEIVLCFDPLDGHPALTVQPATHLRT
uniref:Bifunctional protein: zinc-containing alcohol dehydrogenase quinone oxidoreductase ( NADPH:quinone reductase) Similar to arginate lyase n=2 Tax=Nonomuraea gerenzanensis TaxID=93944 RepID=A0A1M4EGA6_9ACTN|nr:Bifunctional protein: zinc-containing alcohol dehydrogenase; quinone oxidoreductase (NADPH:quinone reductase); Similar to arginate lyase [Nonomuraea gerenzanensis]